MKTLLRESWRWAYTSVMCVLVVSLFSSSLVSAQGPPPTPTPITTPQMGLHYYAIQDLNTGDVIRRGVTGDAGVAFSNLILSPDTPYRIWALQAETLRVANPGLVTPSSGSRFQVPTLSFRYTTSPDTDGDGLHDIGEFIVGTISDPENPNTTDTDVDGIEDGPEVLQGEDPLSGLVARTGIIGIVDTAGDAADVCAINDMAIVADSDAGISVFNIFDGMDPTLIARVDTPGQALRVSCVGNLVAVADCEAGLTVIDVSNPPLAQVVRQFQFGESCAQAIATAGNIAYVGYEEGLLVAADLETGISIDSLSFDEEVRDIFLAGDLMYVLTESMLHAIDYLSGRLETLSSVDSPIVSGRNHRLFVGGGIAYVIHSTGYNTYSLENPEVPSLIQAGTSPQNGWRHMTLNGSGLGVIATGPTPSTSDIGIFDVSSATQTNELITIFPTPGISQSVSIYNGLAYVATGQSGFLVLSYLAFDNQREAPGIGLSASFSLDPAEVEEGKFARLTADVTDDVQVRNVEIYLDGVLVQTDGNFPFEYRFTAPRLAEQPIFTVQAKATDTGGNVTWTDEITVNLLPDETSPRVIQVQPQAGGRAVQTIAAIFNEPMDISTLSENSFQVRFIDSGVGLPLKGVGTPVPGGSIEYREEAKTALLLFESPLANGRYRLSIANSVTDLAGNSMEEEFSSTFLVGNAVFWTKPREGSWQVGANWSTFNVPGPSDTVIASLPEEATIVIDGGNNVVASLFTDHLIDMTDFAAELTVNGPLQLNNLMRMGPRGVLTNALVTMGSEGLIEIVSGNRGTLDGVRINGDVEFLDDASGLFIENNLTLNGLMTIRSGVGTGGDLLNFRDSNQILDGTGTVQFLVDRVTSSSAILVGTGLSLTVGPEMTIQGPGRGMVELGVGGRMMGTVDSSAGQIQIKGEDWTNEGLLHARGEGGIFLNDTWTNAGEIVLEETGTLILGGEFVPSDLGDFNRDGGTVHLSGTIDLATEDLVLNDDLGTWNLDSLFGNGLIQDGVIQLVGATRLIAKGGTLENTTFNGDLFIDSGGSLRVQDNLTLNGRMTAVRQVSIAFRGNGDVVIDGTGEILLEGSVQSRPLLTLHTDIETFTLQPEIELSGGLARIQGSPGVHLLNRGAIHVDRPAFFDMSVDWTNDGLVKTSRGSFLSINGEVWINSGRIELATSSTIETNPNFNTDFTQSATGTLVLDIAGTGEGDIGKFTAGGPVNLDGTLEINLLSGFEPSVGNTFKIMTYPSRVGTFATEEFPDPGVGKDFVLTYGATEVTLDVVSE